MVQPVNSSGSLALSRRPRSNRGPWAAPAEYGDVRIPPKAVIGRRSLPPHAVTAAEVAQARVFESLLLSESAELHELAHRAAGAADHRLNTGGSAQSWDLMQLRVRMDEVQRLLQALRGRFPHQLADSDR